MCYLDGAANMSSDESGIYGLMKKEWGLSLVYQHCRAHKLQLVSKTVSLGFPIVDQTLSSVQSLYTYFNKSNKKVLREEERVRILSRSHFKGLMSFLMQERLAGHWTFYQAWY